MALLRGKKAPPDQEVYSTDSIPTDSDMTPPVVVSPAKRSPLMLFLGGLGLIALAGIGLTVYSRMNAPPPDDNAPAASLPPRPHHAPPPGAPPPPLGKLAPGKPAAPGAPKAPVKVHTIVLAAPATPTPVYPARGLAARPGKPGPPHTVAVVRVIRPTPSHPAKSVTAPQIQTQLKALWRQGADAKHHKDYKTARTAWQAALKLAPSHSGFQDAINKLPR